MRRSSLIFEQPHKVIVQDSRVPRPENGQVLVQTKVSAISAGTEMLAFKGRFPTNIAVDPTIDALPGNFEYPIAYGYCCAGHVISAGTGIDSNWIGRRVFAFHPHASHFVCTPEKLIVLPDHLDMEDAVLFPSMETAVSLVMDALPFIGEHVIVLGLGIIGLLTITLLKKYPLGSLSGLDRFALRRRTAVELGADIALTGEEVDIEHHLNAAAVPTAIDGNADLIFELSGNPELLNKALTWSGLDTRIVVGSWYGNRPASLDLGSRFHRHRIKIISSQVSTIAPRLTGRWSFPRRRQVAINMLQTIAPSKLITHRFDIGQAQNAYDHIAHNPEACLQIILTYPDT